jgi:multidrug efflux system membrane fusion protein
VLVVSTVAMGCRGSAGDPAAAGGGGGRGGKGGRGAAGGAQPVVMARVMQRDVPVDLAAVGNVEAYNSVSVRSQVTGQLQEAFFHEGDVVKKGDKLFTIDPRPLEASLKQAEANLLRDQAQLNQAEAQLARDSANADFQKAAADRQAQLVEKGLVSREQAQQSRATADAIAATIKADKAAIESAKAQLTVQQSVVDNAKVLLSYTTIKAGIEGRTGNNAVKTGNLVSANSTELVTIAQLQPVYVTFTLPATHLSAIKQRMGQDTLLATATPQDGNPEPVEGKLTFIDNTVDTATDTIKLKATFPNKDSRLWPGQFTRVSLRLTTLQQATVVPSQAVQVGQEGQFVFVVKPDSTVEQRPIVVAQRMGEIVVIAKGLAPGETIVTEGQLRLEQGTKVQTGNEGEGGKGGGRGRGGRGGKGGGEKGGGDKGGGEKGGGGEGRGPDGKGGPGREGK